ncbi:MAG: hypothetical protein EOQ52_20510 [Mesorhizobium sp.]|nr:MAG: hypothetical protein EOQ52_20510 [Mesorhizobium sp.]
MSKGDFARHINVSPGRVSQYIAAGMIGSDALQGEGRNAKVIVAKAVEQIRQRRDIGQALGNGLSTRLDVDEPDEAADGGVLLPADVGKPSDDSERLPKQPTVDDEIKQERLQSERRRNRVAAQEEAEKLGRLVDAGTVRAEMAKLAQAVDDENAGMLADFATAIAAQFSVPQRDVLHLLRRIRNEKKAAAADRARRRAASLPERVDMILEGAA